MSSIRKKNVINYIWAKLTTVVCREKPKFSREAGPQSPKAPCPCHSSPHPYLPTLLLTVAASAERERRRPTASRTRGVAGSFGVAPQLHAQPRAGVTAREVSRSWASFGLPNLRAVVRSPNCRRAFPQATGAAVRCSSIPSFSTIVG